MKIQRYKDVLQWWYRKHHKAPQQGAWESLSGARNKPGNHFTLRESKNIGNMGKPWKQSGSTHRALLEIVDKIHTNDRGKSTDMFYEGCFWGTWVVFGLDMKLSQCSVFWMKSMNHSTWEDVSYSLRFFFFFFYYWTPGMHWFSEIENQCANCVKVSLISILLN